MNKYFIAKKETERYSNVLKDKEYEHVTFEVRKVYDKFIIDTILEFIEDVDNGDYEEQYFQGINFSFDDLYSIDVDKFLEAITSEIQEKKDDYDYTDEDKTIIDYKRLYDMLQEFKGFDLIYHEEEKTQ
jgi:hypothetical protein